MSRQISKPMRQLLREAAEALLAAGWTKRGLEKRLHVGNGNLDKLFSGERKLTVDHLMEFVAVLDVPPSQLMALAFPDREAAARRNLSDWIARRIPAERAAAVTPPASRTEIAELLRTALREELDRREPAAAPIRGDGGPPPAPRTANGSPPSSADEPPSWIYSLLQRLGRSLS